VLKWVREGAIGWERNFPFPWEKKRKIQSIAALSGRRSALFDISKMLKARARNHQELEYAKSLMPPEWT
jgi:hypothetical protein